MHVRVNPMSARDAVSGWSGDVQIPHAQDGRRLAGDGLAVVVRSDVSCVAVRRPRAAVVGRWTRSQLCGEVARVPRSAVGARLHHLHGRRRLSLSASRRRRPLRAAHLPAQRHSTSHPVTWYAGARRAAWSSPRGEHCHGDRHDVLRLLAALLVIPGTTLRHVPRNL